MEAAPRYLNLLKATDGVDAQWPGARLDLFSEILCEYFFRPKIQYIFPQVDMSDVSKSPSGFY